MERCSVVYRCINCRYFVREMKANVESFVYTCINDRHCQPGWLSLAAADDRPTDQRTKKKQLSLPKPSKPLHRSCRCRTLPRRKAVLLLLLRSIFELGICPVLLLGMLTEKEGSRKEGRKEGRRLHRKVEKKENGCCTTH